MSWPWGPCSSAWRRRWRSFRLRRNLVDERLQLIETQPRGGIRPQVILNRRGALARLVPGSTIVEVVRLGIALELPEELERFVPRMVEADELAIRPLIGGKLLFVHVPKRKDKKIDFLQCSHLDLLNAGILKTLNHVPEIDMGDFMRQDELKDDVFVLADESEQSTRQVDIASGMRERVDGLGIEDGEDVPDVFS